MKKPHQRKDDVLNNPCLSRNNPSNHNLSPKEKEERVKKILSEAAERKRINKVIDSFLRQFRGKSLIQILPVLEKHCSIEIVELAVERIEKNQRKKLTIEDMAFLKEVKARLAEKRK
ncbi:MAG: hypothetical protein PHI53_03205 [Candidatus Pacebacteria bacterium]|nr:hypothetical protein [Candidatus Paceibacterota bacterium]